MLFVLYFISFTRIKIVHKHLEWKGENKRSHYNSLSNNKTLHCSSQGEIQPNLIVCPHLPLFLEMFMTTTDNEEVDLIAILVFNKSSS